MQTSTKQLVLGRITSTFGVKGWVKIYSYTQPKENIFSYPSWLIKLAGQEQQLKVVEGKVHGKGLIAKLKGVDSPEAAQIYLGQELCINESDLPQLEEGNYYLTQLLNLSVINLQQETLGKVAGFIETGANSVIQVKPCSNSLDKQTRLIPLVMPQKVTQVNLEEGYLTVDWHADY